MSLHCHVMKLPDGTTAIVRLAKMRERRCSQCRRETRDYRLCDYPIGAKPSSPDQAQRTCSVVLCTSCARHRDPDTDYCPLHADAVDGKLRP